MGTRIIMVNKKGTNMKYVTNNPKANEDEDEIEVSGPDFCGYFKNSKVISKLVVPLDEPFKEARYYRMVVDAIRDLGEDDVVEFHINSPGGDLQGLVALLSAIENTEATTVAVLEGEVHSAGSMLAVSCDAVMVGSYANMLCHSVRYGVRGKAADIHAQVLHSNDYNETLMRKCYEYFLTTEETEELLKGKELWLNNEEIKERFQRKFDALNAIESCGDCCGDPDGCSDICSCPLAEDEQE